MKKKFGCTWYAVCKVAESYGLEIPTSNNWTEEEVNTLIELSKKYHYSEIATIMNKTENAIYLKARRLGITLIQDRRKWTAEEEKILQELWGKVKLETIASNLKRSVFSLKVKAIRMGLGSMISNSDLLTISDITELINVSRDRIINTWVNLGLKVMQKKLTKSKSYYVVEWDDLVDFLSQHQDEWDSRCIEPYMLGMEYDWLIEKRKRDRDEDPTWYRKWTLEEIQRAEILLKRGKSYQEISDELKRSELAVANLLRNRGFSYRLPQYWNGQELKYLRENYQDMTYQEIGDEIGRTEKAVSAKAAELNYQKLVKKKKN